MTNQVSQAPGSTVDQHFVPKADLPEKVHHVMKEFFPETHTQFTLTPLKESSVYKVVDNLCNPPKVYVLRRSYPDWTEERCKREVLIAKWIADSKAGPQVIKASNDSRYMLLEYLDGGIFKPEEHIDLKDMANCLRQLHSLGVPPEMVSETKSTTMDRYHRQFANLKELYEELPKCLEDQYQEVLGMENHLNERYQERVLCHGDLYNNNIMHHQGHIMLIDYGMTGPDHPYFDLANFAMYHLLSDKEERQLLGFYLNREVDETTWKEYAFIRPLVYLNKTTFLLRKAQKIGADSKAVLETWNSEKGDDTLQKEFERAYYTRNQCGIPDYVSIAHAAFNVFQLKKTR